MQIQARGLLSGVRLGRGDVVLDRAMRQLRLTKQAIQRNICGEHDEGAAVLIAQAGEKMQLTQQAREGIGAAILNADKRLAVALFFEQEHVPVHRAAIVRAIDDFRSRFAASPAVQPRVVRRLDVALPVLADALAALLDLGMIRGLFVANAVELANSILLSSAVGRAIRLPLKRADYDEFIAGRIAASNNRAALPV